MKVDAYVGIRKDKLGKLHIFHKKIELGTPMGTVVLNVGGKKCPVRITDENAGPFAFEDNKTICGFSPINGLECDAASRTVFKRNGWEELQLSVIQKDTSWKEIRELPPFLQGWSV